MFDFLNNGRILFARDFTVFISLDIQY